MTTLTNGFHRLPNGHNDLILALHSNLYGTRMVTASSDHRLKVWTRSSTTNQPQWTLDDTWTAHSAEVTSVQWNGPYTGTHLASTGEDGYLKIWAEDVSAPLNSGRRFRRIFQQASVTGVPYMDLEFKGLGGGETYLAVVTRDGHLSVQEPEDGDDLSSWRVLWSDYLCKTPPRTQETGFRLSWHKEPIPAWPAILAGLDRRSLSLVVATGDIARVFRTDRDRKFYTAATLEGAKDLIRDVSWGYGSIRGFDTVATASRDGRIRVYELHTPGAAALPKSSRTEDTSTPNGTPTLAPHNPRRSGISASIAGGAREDEAGTPGAVRQEVRLVAELAVHGTPWRVGFSETGELLYSTGDDGTVRMWRRAGGEGGKWLEAAEVDGTGER